MLPSALKRFISAHKDFLPPRAANVQAHPVERPRVQLAPGDCERIEREVMSVRDQIQRELLDLYEAHLYGY